jgi:hypothetical protein
MFGFVSDIVSGAAHAVEDVAHGVADVASDVAEAVGEGAEDLVDDVEDIAGGVVHVGDVFITGAGELGELAWEGVRETVSLAELAVSEGSKAVGTGLSVGERLADGIEGLFDKALSTFDDARGWVSDIVHAPLDRISPRLGEAFATITDIPGAIVSSVAHDVEEAASAFVNGAYKLAQGDVRGALGELGSAFVTAFVQLPADALIVGGGAAISGVQTAVGLEPVGRKLNEDEIAALHKVYGDSIDYSRVRIKEGSAGLLGLGGDPMTRGNTIYIPKGTDLTKNLLVHEMCHVWQYQQGGADYMAEAVWAQKVTDGYDYAKGLEQGKSWEQLNPEQQAELLETAFRKNFFDSPNATFLVNGKDYSEYLRDALQKVRRGEGAA